MDGLALVQAATAAGLELRLDAEKLVIRGPKRLATLVAEVIRKKPEVIAALERQSFTAISDSTYSAKVEREDESRKSVGIQQQFDSLVETAPGVWTRPDFEPSETININDVQPCSRCGSYLLRQTFATTWHCQHCDPNHKAERLQNLADKLRSNRPKKTRKTS